jgi:hypothetical protein
VGSFVVRKDHPHAVGRAGHTGEVCPNLGNPDGPGVDSRVARLVGERKRVLIFGCDPARLRRALEAQDCQTVAGAISDTTAVEIRCGEPGDEDGDDRRFDAVVLAGILGRATDSRVVLHTVKEQLRPDGALIVTLGGITAVGGWLAMVDERPLGAGSGVLFTENGLIGLLEESGYAIGHIEGVESPVASAIVPAVRDCLIVAYPLPVAGLDHLQCRMRDLARQSQEVHRETVALKLQVAVSAQRLELLAGHEQRMAARIRELRARLLEAHSQMIRGDDEMRKTFGNAIDERNALLIERDVLAGQRDALVAERADRDALLEERRKLQDALRSAERRLDFLRKSPLGLVYRAFRRLFPHRGGGAIR